MKNPTSGFTLIELLFVITIISILLSLSYPSYQHYLEQARRTDGQAALLDLANRLEDYYAEHNTYADATLGTGNPETDIFPFTTSAAEWYSLSIITQDNDFFLIQATPQKAQISDTSCQSLTLNSVGEKGVGRGPEGMPTKTVKDCW